MTDVRLNDIVDRVSRDPAGVGKDVEVISQPGTSTISLDKCTSTFIGRACKGDGKGQDRERRGTISKSKTPSLPFPFASSSHRRSASTTATSASTTTANRAASTSSSSVFPSATGTLTPSPASQEKSVLSTGAEAGIGVEIALVVLDSWSSWHYASSSSCCAEHSTKLCHKICQMQDMTLSDMPSR